MHLLSKQQALRYSRTLQYARGHQGQRFHRAVASATVASPLERIALAVKMERKPAGPTRKLEDLNFDNLTLRSLPIDPVVGGPIRQVEGACFTRVPPTPLNNPQLVVASPEALSLLDIDPAEISRPDFAAYFSGNRLLPGSDPAAHCYCGHQFGYFSGQLGDGAALYLGEVVNSAGERWELQLKGAGKTPYSRQADGRKVLRSSLREFLCSEAMYHLGIPTTRAGSCVTSDSRVVRDVFYSGNPIMERCSVVSRIAPTFLRFGSFEIFKPVDSVTGRRGSSAGLESALLPPLLHHTIRTYFPHIWHTHGGEQLAAGVGVAQDGSGEAWPPGPLRGPGGGEVVGGGERAAALQDMYEEWLREVTARTASLVAAWQGVGWCHGVLNTDNLSVVGVTLDYGPFGFLDRYDPDFICNGSDDTGRYDFKGQPDICRWNCEKLAEAIRAVLPEARGRRAVAEVFDQEYRRTYLALMRRKLGLMPPRPQRQQQQGTVDAPMTDTAAPTAAAAPNSNPSASNDGTEQQQQSQDQEEEGDEQRAAEDLSLVSELLSVMADTGADFTNTFRCLSRFPVPPAGSDPGAAEAVEAGGVLEYILSLTADIATLAEAAAPRIPPGNLAMLTMLETKNRELLAQMGVTPQMLATERARQRRSEQLAKLGPEAKRQQDRERWAGWLAAYGARLQRAAAAGAEAAERVAVMQATNPRFILRNWIAQQAIEKAEAGDFSEVARVYALLQHPFSDADVGQLISTAAEDAAAASTAAAAAVAAAAPPAGPADEGAGADGGGGGGGAAAGAGAACSLPRYDGRPPAWASKLCVTCSS